MATYKSKFSGVEIDRAVAYFNSIEQAGRTILSVSVNSNNWKGSASPYYVDITIEGVYTVIGTESGDVITKPPQIYFVETGTDAGQKWDIDYRVFKDPANNNKIFYRCYSNRKIAGNIIIMSVMSMKTAEGDQYIDGDLTVNGNIYQLNGTSN